MFSKYISKELIRIKQPSSVKEAELLVYWLNLHGIHVTLFSINFAPSSHMFYKYKSIDILYHKHDNVFYCWESDESELSIEISDLIQII